MYNRSVVALVATAGLAAVALLGPAGPAFASTAAPPAAPTTQAQWQAAVNAGTAVEVQMVAIPAILIHENVGPLSGQAIGYWGLWLSLGLSLFSAAQYVLAYARTV